MTKRPFLAEPSPVTLASSFSADRNSPSALDSSQLFSSLISLAPVSLRAERGTMSGSGSLRGLSAYDRHARQASVYDPDAARAKATEARCLTLARTDFDVLKEAHRFIRDDDDDDRPGNSGASATSYKDMQYAEAVARRYEDSLFKEFALCDLKHWRSGRVALRWRTTAEVLELIGEETCGSLRCAYHESTPDHPPPPLSTFELPFAYEEAGVAKQAMVKVVLCSRCAKKLKLPRTDDRAADGSGSRRRRASDETRLEGSPRRSDRSRRKEALPQRDASRRSASPPQSERRRRDERDGSGGSDGQARRSSSRREG